MGEIDLVNAAHNGPHPRLPPAHQRQHLLASPADYARARRFMPRFFHLRQNALCTLFMRSAAHAGADDQTPHTAAPVVVVG